MPTVYFCWASGWDVLGLAWMKLVLLGLFRLHEGLIGPSPRIVYPPKVLLSTPLVTMLVDQHWGFQGPET